MAQWRLAVVVLVPPPVTGEIDVLRRALGVDDLDRVPPHLTLVPPVNVRGPDLDDALSIVRQAAADRDVFTVEVGPITSFDPITPTIHLAVSDPEGRLDQLRSAVFRPPLWRNVDHPFVPHVTLAEQAPLHRIRAATTALADYRAPLAVERLSVLQEQRGPDRRRRWRPIADVDVDGIRIVGRGGLPTELVTGTMLDPLAAAELGLEQEAANRTAPYPVVVARREGRAIGAVWADDTTGCQAEDDNVVGLLRAEWLFRREQRRARAG
jgi:2'-5' RNA ligase